MTADRLTVTLETIVATTARHFSLRPSDILGMRRDHSICVARHIAMYLAHRVAGASYSEIGRHFTRHHTTVMADVRSVAALADRKLSTALHIRTLTRQLNPASDPLALAALAALTALRAT